MKLFKRKKSNSMQKFANNKDISKYVYKNSAIHNNKLYLTSSRDNKFIQQITLTQKISRIQRTLCK